MKTYLRKQIEAESDLPKGLKFLTGQKFYAITQRRIAGKLLWNVEITTASFAKLLKSKSSVQGLEAQVAELQARYIKYEATIEQLRDENEKLNAANEQLMRNIDADQKRDSFKRSPKNYFNIVEEKSFKTLAGLPFQGGSGGLNKK